MGFYSIKLSKTEHKYAATELEGLVVINAINYFAAYLIGRPFNVETDHKALQFLHSSRHRNGRPTKWALKLQQYNFTVRYRPGALNKNADSLSRQAWLKIDKSKTEVEAN